MKKLELNVDDLVVESFRTEELEAFGGTVRGNDSHFHMCDTEAAWLCTQAQVSCDFGCNTADNGTCPSGHTCQNSCEGTCDTCNTCQGSCFDDTCPNTICLCPSSPC